MIKQTVFYPCDAMQEQVENGPVPVSVTSRSSIEMVGWTKLVFGMKASSDQS